MLLGASNSDTGGLIFLFVVVLLACAFVTVIGLIDVLKQPPAAPFQSGTKAVWVVVILLTSVLGAILYFIAGAPKYEDDDHEVILDPTDGTYWCDTCDFESKDVHVARMHRDGIAPPIPTPAPAVATISPVLDAMKTCPDCAEPIRAAARKCRFCGYLFQPSVVSD